MKYNLTAYKEGKLPAAHPIPSEDVKDGMESGHLGGLMKFAQKVGYEPPYLVALESDKPGTRKRFWVIRKGGVDTCFDPA